MGGHGGPSGYKQTFHAKVPTTELQGSEKQVAWAKDIRDGIVRAVQQFYDAKEVMFEKNIQKGGKVGEKAKKKLEDMPAKAQGLVDALAKVTSAKWFIDHKSLALDKVATKEQLKENKYDIMSASIFTGDLIESSLKKGGFLK